MMFQNLYNGYFQVNIIEKKIIHYKKLNEFEFIVTKCKVDNIITGYNYNCKRCLKLIKIIIAILIIIYIYKKYF